MQISRIRPRFNRLAKFTNAVCLPILKAIGRMHNVHDCDSRVAHETRLQLRNKLQRGETIWILGVTPTSHNTGAALVEPV